MKKYNSKLTTYNLALFLFFSLLLVLANSCDTTNPPSNKKVTLEFEDASCTEAWLNLKSDNITLPTKVNIIKNDSTIITANINSTDTTLYIENLLPNKTYTFQTIIQSTNQKSNSVSVTTMDTTTHNFTWETFTFGGGRGSSYLMDVAIINENNIWAVGEIHTEDTDKFDSNGVWVQPYNAVHWDGSEWELMRIANSGYKRNVVFAFGENDIWFDGTIHWDGVKYSVHMNGFPLLPNGDGWRINSMWGISSKDFYVVGSGGNIAHYNGSSWKKIESGTELDINDIWGDYNEKTGNWEILCVASDLQYNTNRTVLKINNDDVEKIETTSISQPLQSLWFKSNRKYYLVGSGIYTKNSLTESGWDRLSRDISIYFKYKIVAQNMNDLIITCAFNEVLHFNGVSWYSYRGKELPFASGRLMGANYTNNIICIVGEHDREGVLHIGKKQGDYCQRNNI
jgi:hypothetical protein